MQLSSEKKQLVARKKWVFKKGCYCSVQLNLLRDLHSLRLRCCVKKSKKSKLQIVSRIWVAEPRGESACVTSTNKDQVSKEWYTVEDETTVV